MQTRTEALKQSRTKVIVTLDTAERDAAEKKAYEKLASTVKVEGFRPGKAPMDVLKDKIEKDKVLEETVRAALPDVMKAAMDAEEEKPKPILQPAISVEKTDPLEISVLFVEHPEVKVKGAKKISIKKEPMPEPTNEEIDGFIQNIMDRDRKEAQVDRPAKDGDVVEVALTSTNEDGTPFADLTVAQYSFTLGKEDLLKDIEKELSGVKAGDKKEVNLDFPKDHEVPVFQGKKVKVVVDVKSVKEVSLPELNAEYIKTRLGADKSVEEFKKDVATMLKSQKGQSEMQRREQELMKEIKDATTVDLAPELVNAESRMVLEEFADRLKKQGLTLEDWMKSTNKDQKAVETELDTAAKDRLTLRFGMREFVKEKEVEVSDQEVTEFLTRAAGEEEAKKHTPGSPGFEDAKVEVKVQKVVTEMVKD